MPRIAKSSPSEKFAANIGFEYKLWRTADKLRSNIDAAEYTVHVSPASKRPIYSSGRF